MGREWGRGGGNGEREEVAPALRGASVLFLRPDTNVFNPTSILLRMEIPLTGLWVCRLAAPAGSYGARAR